MCTRWNVLMTAAFAAAVSTGLTVAAAQQADSRSTDAHVAAAKAAAGQEYTALFNRLCVADVAPAPARGAAGAGSSRPQGPPERAVWHAEPMKIFDNLYFVGTREHSAWAVTTSDRIVVIDPLYAYAVEDEVVGGLSRLGFNPANIRHVLVSHGHGDHSGGAKLLQDRFGARVVLGAPDWDLVERRPGASSPAPRRDIVATDGQKIELGDVALTLHLTPGHTPGTFSTLIPVKDGTRTHLAALWGGTAFNFPRTVENFRTYIGSTEKYADIVTRNGVDVVLSNHTAFDGSQAKMPRLAERKAGEPHPYVVGTPSVKRYLQVAGECAKAALARLEQ